MHTMFYLLHVCILRTLIGKRDCKIIYVFLKTHKLTKCYIERASIVLEGQIKYRIVSVYGLRKESGKGINETLNNKSELDDYMSLT